DRERQRGLVLGVLRLGRGARRDGRAGRLRGGGRRGLRPGLAVGHRRDQRQQQCGERDPRSHRCLSVNTACTRPPKVVYSSAIRTSSAEPSATAPPRESRTGSSVHRRFSAPVQRSTFVSRRTPSLEVSTTFFRISRFFVAWKRSPSSPTIVQERSR